ncbi:MAG: hypothetical protein ACI37Z_04415, partial [Candidatus Gastranaerophilaceae bacterium]
KIDIKNVVFLTILFLIIIYGCILRTYVWFHHSYFFGDEILLFKNIYEKNYLELFGALNYCQCCPPIFLICGKIIYSIFGYNERLLSTVNFSAGILSILLFPLLSFKVFKQKISILSSVFLFTYAEEFIHYSMFFKQYSFDVLFSIIVLFAVFSIKDKKLSNLQMFFLSLFCIFCVFCSYTAGFLIFLYALFFIFKSFKEKTIRQNLKPFLIFIIPFASVMVWFFFVNCLPTLHNELLRSFWNDFSTSIFFYPQNIKQIKLMISFVLKCDFYNINLFLYLFFMLSSLVSFYYLLKNNKFALYILVSPFILALILGIFQLYPFSANRTSLYLIPVIILFIAFSFENINNYTNYFNKYLIKNILLTSNLTICFFIFIFCFYITMFNFEKNYNWFPNNKELVNLLYKSDIDYNKDYILYEVAHLTNYDYKKVLKEKNMFCYYEQEAFQKLKKGSNLYFFDAGLKTEEADYLSNWLNKNCKKIYDITGINYKLIKYEKISD